MLESILRVKFSRTEIPNDHKDSHREDGEHEDFLKRGAGQTAADPLASEQADNSTDDEQCRNIQGYFMARSDLGCDSGHTDQRDHHQGRADGAVNRHAAEEHEGGDNHEATADAEDARQHAGEHADDEQQHGAPRIQD